MINIRNILLSTIIACVALTGIFTVYTGFANSFDQQITQDMQPLYAKSVEITGDSNQNATSRIYTDFGAQASDALFNSTTKEQSGFNMVIQNAYNALKYLASAPTITYSLLEKASAIIGIPKWIVTTTFVLLMIILIVAAIMMFFRMPQY